LIVSLALVPALAFQAYTESQARHVRHQLVEDEALRLVHLVSAEQQRIVEGAEQVLDTISSTPAVQDADLERCQRLLSRLLELSPRYNFAAVIGLDGHTICASGPLDAATNASDRGYFQRAIETGGFVIGEYSVGRGSRRPTLHMAKPFRNRDGQVAGVIEVSLSTDWLGRQLETLSLPPDAAVSVTDRNGIVIARFPNGEQYVGKPMPAETRYSLFGNEIRVVEMKGLDGLPRIVAYSPADGALRGLRIGVGLVRDTTFAAVTQANRIGLALIFLGAVLALATTALLGAGLIGRPVARLLAAAEHWRRGDLAVRTGMRADASEFGRLAAAFDRMAAAHQDRERTLRTALESTTDCVLVLDRAGHITYLNERAKAILGQGRDLLGRVIWDAFPMLALSAFGDAYVKATESGAPAHVEAYAPTLSRYLDAYAYPSTDSLTVFFRDVTVERRMEFALRQSERSFRSTFEQIAVGMGQSDLEGRWLRVNDKLCAITGYGRDELLAQHFQDITHPDDLQIGEATRKRLIAGEIATYTHEKRYVRKDGGVVWVNITASLLRDADDRPERIVCVIEDISERKRMEMALHENEARLRAVLEEIPAAVTIVEQPDGAPSLRSRYSDILFDTREADPQAISRLRREAAEHPDGSPYALDEYPSTRALRHGETIMAEPMLYRRGDGKLIELEIYAAPVRDAVGTITAAVVAAFDVSLRNRAERLLAQSNADLETRVREEVAAREAAQARAAHAERIQALGQLAGGIAHDFNNVLQTVEGAVVLIERDAEDAQRVRRMARLLLDAIGRGASVTRRLLAFGRRGDLRSEALDPAELLADLREVLAHTLGAGAAVDIRVEAGVPLVLADKGQVETALVNLATNARDAMPDGGTLTLSVAAEVVPPDGPAHPAGLAPGAYVRFRVADTGTGMDAATLARAGEPFFTTKAPGAGTGLGLSMAKGFVEQSGGALNLESWPGRGTTVTLWLPQAAERPPAPPEPPVEADAPPAAASAGESAPVRVMLVDDEDLLRELLAEHLTDAGYTPLMASSGAEAIALFESGERVDVLVTDFAMPGPDGLAVIRAAQACQPGLPAVLLTGYAGDSAALAMRATVSGSFSRLNKPVRIHELLDRIQALLAARVKTAR
jgi:PAS domain S-box-containing protein